MNVEDEYYENDAFWNNEGFGTIDTDRIKSISELIPADVRSILDVGCGNGLFLNYLSNNFNKYLRLHGVDRCDTALKYVKTHKTKSSIDSLPFSDNEFDLVSALEVVEHLQNNIFLEGLCQLCRVSKKHVLLSVPNGESLKKTLIECPQCKTMFNPDYHMRRFDENILRGLLVKFGFKCKEIHYIGRYHEYLLVSRVLNSIRAFKGRKNPFSTEIPCPVCGNYLDAGVRSSSDEKASHKSRSKDLFKRFLPQKVKYRWIVGLYERV
jgi:ubiquinone/menaquinone biosynthesis C-methylase UbiE